VGARDRTGLVLTPGPEGELPVHTKELVTLLITGGALFALIQFTGLKF
jgi:hypothetical protein